MGIVVTGRSSWVVGMLHSLMVLASYYLNEEQYTSEKNVARQYAGQKVWPRAVYIRRARYVAKFRATISGLIFYVGRFYNAARLRWNSIERKRGPVEDSLIDDIVEWSMWHYSSVRQYVLLYAPIHDHLLTLHRSSQSVLEGFCTVREASKFPVSRPPNDLIHNRCTMVFVGELCLFCSLPLIQGTTTTR